MIGSAEALARDRARRTDGNARAVLDALPEDGPPLWLSIDVDVLDPAFAPGTGTPEPGGLATWELLAAVGELSAHRPLAGMEIVEVAPAYDPAGITAVAAHRVVQEALTGMARRTPD